MTWKEEKTKRPGASEGGVVCFDVIASQAHPSRSGGEKVRVRSKHLVGEEETGRRLR